MSLKEILDAVSTLGTLGFALLVVYGFLSERIVPKGRLDDLKADKDKAVEAAEKTLAAVERLSDLLERDREDAARRRR